jgi:hypothetical protein
MATWTVYCHMHTESGRRYIGLTSRTMERRWAQHIIQARSSKGGRWHFPNAIRKYGPEAFSHEVLEICSSLEEANRAEERWIGYFDSRNPEKGFNLAKGGAHTPHSIKNPWDRSEYRVKQIAAVKKRSQNPIYLAKLSANLKAFWQDPAWAAKRSATLKIIANTPEAKAKRSIISKKLWENNEFRARESASLKATYARLLKDPNFRAKYENLNFRANSAKHDLIRSSIILTRKFGKLKMKIPRDVFPCSNKKIEWVCDCGKEICAIIADVLSGHTSSCGYCNEIPASNIANRKFGKLHIKTPQNILPGSNQYTTWVCDCGRETNKQIYQVIHGYTTSCGLCNLIPADIIADTKFGKLRIKIPQDIFPGSDEKIVWICDCGKETTTRISYVISGNTKSCGRCNEIFINHQKFGKLHIKLPQNITIGSGKKIEWICDCGKITTVEARRVISGNVKSCASCHKLNSKIGQMVNGGY